MSKNWYWLSFSHSEHGSQGVVVIEAEAPELALQQAKEKNLQPEQFNDIEMLRISEPEIEPNKLHTPKDMEALGYTKRTVQR